MARMVTGPVGPWLIYMSTQRESGLLGLELSGDNARLGAPSTVSSFELCYRGMTYIDCSRHNYTT